MLLMCQVEGSKEGDRLYVELQTRIEKACACCPFEKNFGIRLYIVLHSKENEQKIRKKKQIMPC